MHSVHCLRQECEQTSQLCGKEKFCELFDNVTDKLGQNNIEVFQHMRIRFNKPDGSHVSTNFLTKFWLQNFQYIVSGHKISAWKINCQFVFLTRFFERKIVRRKGTIPDSSSKERAWQGHETKSKEKFKTRWRINLLRFLKRWIFLNYICLPFHFKNWSWLTQKLWKMRGLVPPTELIRLYRRYKYLNHIAK